MRIGTDIIEISRIEKAIEQTTGFRERVFTAREINYCESRGKQRFASYAARYAAKEAFVKALGTGFREGSWQDLEVVNDEAGAPKLICTGMFKEKHMNSGYVNVELSLSHCQTYAVATIILY